MISQPVTIRRRRAGALAHVVAGWVPFPESPLAVTPAMLLHAETRWEVDPEGGFIITHVPTGYQVGDAMWDEMQQAAKVLQRCDPTFPAWALAYGPHDQDAATKACRVKYRWAMAQ